MNNRDRIFTTGKVASRLAHLEADVACYITDMVRIDRQQEGELRAETVQHLARRHGRIRQEIARLKAMDRALADALDGQISLADPDARAMATGARNSGIQRIHYSSNSDQQPAHKPASPQGFHTASAGRVGGLRSASG